MSKWFCKSMIMRKERNLHPLKWAFRISGVALKWTFCTSAFRASWVAISICFFSALSAFILASCSLICLNSAAISCCPPYTIQMWKQYDKVETQIMFLLMCTGKMYLTVVPFRGSLTLVPILVLLQIVSCKQIEKGQLRISNSYSPVQDHIPNKHA